MQSGRGADDQLRSRPWMRVIAMTVLNSPQVLYSSPLTWMYSPDVIHRKAPPSNLRGLVKTTVLAGMLSPVDMVSVAKRALRRPSWKRIWRGRGRGGP